MAFSVLIVADRVERALSLQRGLHNGGTSTGHALTLERAWRGLEGAAPDAVVVDHAVGGDALAFFSLLAQTRPNIRRVLLVHVAASLFARERESGLIHLVAYEHTVVPMILEMARAANSAPPEGTNYSRPPANVVDFQPPSSKAIATIARLKLSDDE